MSPLAEPQPQRINSILLVAALVSACVLMVPLLTAGPLTLDEHGSYWLLESDIPSTMLERSLRYAAIPPLSAWLQAVCISLGGKNELAFRLSSAIPFVAAIYVVYVVGNELGSAPVGGISAMLLAWHPEAMDECRIARCYGLILLLSALSILFTVRWARSPFNWKYAAGWAIPAAALLWTHYVTAPLIAFELLILIGILQLDSQPRRRSWSLLAAALVFLVIAGLPLVPSVLRMSAWNAALSFGQTAAKFWPIFGPLWIVGLAAGIVVARILSRRRSTSTTHASSRQNLVAFLVIGLAPLVLMYAATHFGYAGLNYPRYRVAFAVPGVCCLAMLLSRRSKEWAAAIGTVVLIACTWSLQPNRPWQPTRLAGAERAEWRDIGLHIEREGHAGEAVFVQSGLTESFLVSDLYQDRLFMDYVACRVGKFYLPTEHPRHAMPFIWSRQPQMIDYFRKLIRSSALKGETIWVASATDTDLCRNSIPAIDALLVGEGYFAASQTQYSTAQLVRYDMKARQSPTSK